MTKLYADLHQRHRQQVTFKVDKRITLNTESMSSLSDVSDLAPPPDDDVNAELISRVYGIGRKPTTIALTFRPPLKQRTTGKLPKLVTKKTMKPRGGCHGNVTSPAVDAVSTGDGVSCHSDGSHVISGKQNGGIVTSKSMHSLSKIKPEVNRRAIPACTDVNEVTTITTLSERHRAVTSSTEVNQRRTSNGLMSSNCRAPIRNIDANGTRANSVINLYLYFTFHYWMLIIPLFVGQSKIKPD